jgi:Arc/MetJ family transcription regulator
MHGSGFGTGWLVDASLLVIEGLQQSNRASMRVRTQITIDRDLLRRAQAKTARLGISFSEYVGRLVAADLGARERKAHSKRPDISIVFDLRHVWRADRYSAR